MDKQSFINQLHLQPHPEGGWYRQVYHSDAVFTPTTVNHQRYFYTSIYFLLDANSPSHLHQLKHDEIWYYHAGDSITIHCFYPDGSYKQAVLGPNILEGELLQYRVPAGVIFGSEVTNDNFSLVSCAVAPGFDYHDFKIFSQEQLLSKYPNQSEVIKRLAYKTLPNN